MCMIARSLCAARQADATAGWHATFDSTEIRAMHYMMLSHDHTKSPGRYRKGPIFVRDERRDLVV